MLNRDEIGMNVQVLEYEHAVGVDSADLLITFNCHAMQREVAAHKPWSTSEAPPVADMTAIARIYNNQRPLPSNHRAHMAAPVARHGTSIVQPVFTKDTITLTSRRARSHVVDFPTNARLKKRSVLRGRVTLAQFRAVERRRWR